MTVRVSPDLTSACPRGCSGHGECLQGQCQCSPGYIGQDCALSEYLSVKQPFLLYLLFKPFSYVLSFRRNGCCQYKIGTLFHCATVLDVALLIPSLVALVSLFKFVDILYVSL